MTEPVTCPTNPIAPDGTPHTIIGCGSSNVTQDDSEPAIYDCGDCGIWFNIEEERRGERPEQVWQVIYTPMPVTARTAEEAIARAEDSNGGGNWEATLVSDPIATYHRKAAESGLEVMGHILDVVWNRLDGDAGTTAVIGRLTPKQLTDLYEQFVAPAVNALTRWVDEEADDWLENHCSEEGCDESLEDGEGYDGLCGTHADQAEQAGKWS